jgi:hypothetical protein
LAVCDCEQFANNKEHTIAGKYIVFFIVKF